MTTGCHASTINADAEGWDFTSNRGLEAAHAGSEGNSGNTLRAVLECLGLALERGAERAHLDLEDGDVARSIQQRLFRRWREDGWRDEDGRPVPFPELWEAIEGRIEDLDQEVTANGPPVRAVLADP